MFKNKRGLVFIVRCSNDISASEDVGTVTPSSKINVLISLGDSPVDLSLRNLSISWTSM